MNGLAKWAIRSVAAFVFLCAGAASDSADYDADNLPDAWEATHGFSTNGLPNTNLTLSALVGWWQMDDTSQTNVTDRSTNNLTGTLFHFPSYPFVTGLFSNALSFTTNSYVSFSGTNSVLCFTNSFTISLWFSGSNATEETTLMEWTPNAPLVTAAIAAVGDLGDVPELLLLDRLQVDAAPRLRTTIESARERIKKRQGVVQLSRQDC